LVLAAHADIAKLSDPFFDRAIPQASATGKLRALPAQRMRPRDRGVLQAGIWAEAVVSNRRLANGVPVIDKGKMTTALPGKVLRWVAPQRRDIRPVGARPDYWTVKFAVVVTVPPGVVTVIGPVAAPAGTVAQT
jgi:hypothetical protein